MIKLPSGLEINNLIDDLKIISWEASKILLHYSKVLKKKEDKSIVLNNNNENPAWLPEWSKGAKLMT